MRRSIPIPALLAAVPRLGSMRGSDLPRHFPLPEQAVPDEEEQKTVIAGEPILKVRDRWRASRAAAF